MSAPQGLWVCLNGSGDFACLELLKGLKDFCLFDFFKYLCQVLKPISFLVCSSNQTHP